MTPSILPLYVMSSFNSSLTFENSIQMMGFLEEMLEDACMTCEQWSTEHRF